jgi:hypothetical protein
MNSNQEEFGVEIIEKCSYEKYHDYIDLACTGSLKTAIEMSSKGCAIQLDCSDISPDDINEPLIILDFYNQNCEAFNSEFPCISLVGNNGLHRCLGKNWGYSYETKEVDISSSSLWLFSESTGLSFKNIHIVSTDIIYSYLTL